MAVDHVAMPLVLSPQLGLRVHYTAVKGRHLLTTRQFKAGEIVLAQQPYAAVLDAEHVSSHCDHCFLSKPDLLRCGRSQFARYCNRAHQKAAWDAGYKQECRAFVSTPSGRHPTATMRLAARAIWKAARETNQAVPEGSTATAAGYSHVKQWPAPGGTWADVLSLHHHWQRLPPHMQLVCAQVADAARSFAASGMTTKTDASTSATTQAGILPTNGSSINMDLTNNPQPLETAQASSGNQLEAADNPPADNVNEWETDGLPSIKCIAQLIARFTSNCHTICDEELRPVGMGLYPLAALANHSCNPSCMQSFEGSTMTFRALRDLDVGEEVTIAYVDLAATLQSRREMLWEQYHFDVCDAVTDTGTPTSPENKGIASIILRPEPLFGLQRSQNDANWEVTRVENTRAGNNSSGMSSMMVYGSMPGNKNTYLPPWPSDKHDAALTCIEVRVSPAASFTTLPGGLQAALNSSAASQLDTLFEGMLDELGDQDQTTMTDKGLQSLTLSDVASNPAKQPQRQKQQQSGGYPGCQVDCWGPWAGQATNRHTSAAANVCEGFEKGLASIATNIDTLCNQLWQAQKLAQHGKHSEAVGVLKHALQQADNMTVVMHTQQLSCLDMASQQTNEQATVQLRLGPQHHLRMQLLAALLKAAIDGGSEWEVALQAAKQLTPIYEMMLPRPWPWLGLHYATVAKLAAFQEQLRLALTTAEQALDTLKTTHGTGAWGQAGRGVIEQIARLRYEMQQELHAAR